jgi:hypothetical protein
MVNNLTRSNCGTDPNKSMESLINMQRASLRKIKNWRPNDLDTTNLTNNENKNENKPEENAGTKRVKDDILIGLNRPAGIVRRMASSISNQILNNSKTCLNSNSNDKSKFGDSNPRNKNYSSFNLKRPVSSFIQTSANQVKLKHSSSISSDDIQNSKLDIKPFVVRDNKQDSTPKIENVTTKSNQVKTIQFKGDFQLKETENGIQIQVRQPHLISVTNNNVNNEDLNRLNDNSNFNKTSIKIYPFKLGRTTIGSSPNNDIVLTGPSIEPEHCFIENNLILLNRNSKSRSCKDNSCNSNNSINESESDKKKSLFGPHSLTSLFKLNKTKDSKNKLPKGNLVTLYPIARLCAIDGVLIENPYQLNSGFYFVLVELIKILNSFFLLSQSHKNLNKNHLKFIYRKKNIII